VRGATLILYNHQFPSKFQSTRPCGARLRYHVKIPDWLSFNPRARAGRDSDLVDSPILILLFQSTRPCGARQ